jgi:uncharacterized protein (TIGR00369 family)
MDRNTRRERLLRLFHGGSHIVQTLNLGLSFTEDDRAMVHMPYDPAYDHAAGSVHGGVYAVLMDTAGWFASAVTRDPEDWPATAELSMHLLKAAREAPLRAEGRMIKGGRRQDVVEMLLYNDLTGELVGHATGTFVPSGRIVEDLGLEQREHGD